MLVHHRHHSILLNWWSSRKAPIILYCVYACEFLCVLSKSLASSFTVYIRCLCAQRLPRIESALSSVYWMSRSASCMEACPWLWFVLADISVFMFMSNFIIQCIFKICSSCAHVFTHPTTQRLETLSRFKSRDIEVMVVTDLAARGLDIPDVKTVRYSISLLSVYCRNRHYALLQHLHD